MDTFVDLSHAIADGMPGFRMTDEDGETVEYTARVEPFLTHEESARYYADGVSFEITELQLQTSVGTYLDAPAHRYPGGRDIADVAIEEVVAEGIVVDATGHAAGEAVGPEVLPDDVDLEDRAVLVQFGWDEHWGTEQYYEYPSLEPAAIDRLIDRGARLVGVDALNVDDADDPTRPAHSRLLDAEVFVLENLRNLDAVAGRPFRLFAVPLRAEGAVAMPVRAFAAIDTDPLPDGDTE